MNISQEHAFRLEYKIQPQIQNAIIKEVLKSGYTTTEQPFWVQHDVRSVDHSSLWGSYDDEPAPRDFYYRLYPQADWHWETNNITPLIMPLAMQVEHLFEKMTRIKVFIQKPGESIAAHRDLVPGNRYEHIGSAFEARLGAYSGVYWGSRNLRMGENTRHRDQKYLNLKIPVSERLDDSGKSFIIATNGVKRYLLADDNFYLLNEYEMFHGCDFVDFYRGVIFIDGLLDMEALEAETKLDF